MNAETFLKTTSETPVNVKELLRIASESYGVTTDAILGKSKGIELVHARTYIALALREKKWSLPRIGRALNRDHSTVLNLLQRAEKFLIAS